MGTMLEDTWASRDLPVLSAVARLSESRHGQAVWGSEIQHAVPGLTQGDIATAARALDPEYISLVSWNSDTVIGEPIFGSLTGAGRRAVGLWPTPEALADRAIAVVAERIEEATSEDERSRWVKLRDGLADAGRDVVIDVMGAVVSRQITGA